MTWYKTAKSFTDMETWLHKGIFPPDCKREFAPQKEKRNAMQALAKNASEELGHYLFKDWSPLNSNRCRKCGMTVSLPNVIGITNSPDAIGAAVSEKCMVHLTCSPDHFEQSDKALNGLNKDPEYTVM